MSGEILWASPWLLALALPAWALWAAAFVFLRLRPRAGRFGAASATATFGFSSLAHLAKLGPSLPARAAPYVRGLRVVTLLLLALALGRPQSVRGQAPTSARGIDIILALDTSGSMRALDLDAGKRIEERRNRLQVVQDVVREFVDKRKSDQLGMVVFGAEAFLQCPLTLDHEMVDTLLDRLEVGMAGDQTAIGSGIGAAVSALEHSPAKSKIIVLLTDGVSNTGRLLPKKAAEVARAFGVRIYTIGAGSRGKAPFIVDGGLFGQRVVYDEVSLDEETLSAVAEITGGTYFRAEDSRSLADVYDRIDKLEKSDLAAPSFRDLRERMTLFVVPALVLLLAELIAARTRWQRVP